ncbi:conjugal transfer protein TraB, partial [Cronobacter sakazakii]|nr:conjugal transfer protein TraB [Cronobacter sakazakii]
EKKALATVQKAGDTAQAAVTGNAPANTGSTTTAVGNINPDEVLRQASQLRLGDTIN